MSYVRRSPANILKRSCRRLQAILAVGVFTLLASLALCQFAAVTNGPPTVCPGEKTLILDAIGNNVYSCGATVGQTPPTPKLVTGALSAPPTPGTPSLSPQGSLSYGTQQTGQASPSQLISINNPGPGSINVTGATITGSSEFGPALPNGLNACKGELKGGATCVLSIVYTPGAAGNCLNFPICATLTVTTDQPLDAQNPLTVNFSGAGSATPTGTISLAGFGLGDGSVTDGGSLVANFHAGVCTGQCQLGYPVGTILTLTPTAATTPASVFNTFQGAGCGVTCVFTVTQDQAISVQFDLQPPDIQLTLAATGQGGGRATTDANAEGGNGVLNCVSVASSTSSGGSSGCTGKFPFGTVVNITAVAAANSVLVGLTGSSVCGATSPCGPITLTADITITVNYSLNSSSQQISLIQTTTNCAVVTTTVDCTWGSAQLVGDLNYCTAAWPDNTTTVSSVTDTGLNTYTQVPTASPKTTTGLSQVAYYAQNITAAAAGARHTVFTLSSSGASTPNATSLFSNHDLATANSYASTSITLPNNQIILVATRVQLSTGNGPGPVTSITDTAGGLTWTLVLANDFNSTQGTATNSREEVWRAVGTGATGVVTVHWGTSPVGHAMGISAWSGVDITGGGANAIGNTAKNTGSGTAASVTLGAFASASNGTYAAIATGGSTARTAGAGMTVLGADQQQSDEWAAANVTTPAQTLATSQAWGGIAIEMKAAGGTGRRDVRCREYAGVKQSGSPIDVSAAAVGSSAAPASGSLTTTQPNDLLTGDTASLSSVNTPSAGFTQVLKNSFGDDGENIIGVASGTASNFQPTLTSSANWIATQVAWLPQNGSAPTVFSVQLTIAGGGSGGVTSNVGTPPLNCNSTGSGGTGNCSSQVSPNSNMILTAAPLPGMVFNGWIGITGCGPSTICTVPNITANQVIAANFGVSGQTAYYVAPTGNNSNSGTAPGTPWQTLSFAIAHVNLSTTALINVAPGTYNEAITGCAGRTANLCVNRSGATPTARLSVQCTSVAWPTGSGCLLRNNAANGGITIVANNVDVQGFDYTNPTSPVGIINVCNGNPTTGNCTTGNSVHIRGNYLHDIGQTANDGGPGGLGCPSFGAIYAGSTQHGTAYQNDVQMIGNRISNYGDQSKAVRNGGVCNFTHGIYSNGPNVLIENNVIIQAATFNIQIYNQACNSVISNNTLDQAGKGNIVIANGTTCAQGPTGRISILNNIMESAPSGGITLGTGGGSPCTAASRVLIANNLTSVGQALTNGALNGCTDVSGNVQENPTVTFSGYNGSSTTNNYQLAASSIAINGAITGPCVNGGTSPCVPQTDFAGIARPQRAKPDIGAYELP